MMNLKSQEFFLNDQQHKNDIFDNDYFLYYKS